MLFFLNNEQLLNDSINFHQIFFDYKLIDLDDEYNKIYFFDSFSESKKNNINILNHKLKIIDCKIKIIDNLISYETNSLDKNYIFSFKTKFINNIENKFELPIFLHVYKYVNSKRFPNILEKDYHEIHSLNFKIYDLENSKDIKIQYIIETNILTNFVRKYFITTNLNSIENYIN